MAEGAMRRVGFWEVERDRHGIMFSGPLEVGECIQVVSLGTEWHEAGREAYWSWQRLAEATTPLQTAQALIDLANAMSDLASWLPGYDINTGTIAEDGGA